MRIVSFIRPTARSALRRSTKATRTRFPFDAQFTLHRPPYQRKRFDLDSAAAHTAKGIVSPAISPNGKRVVFEALNQLWLLDGRPTPNRNP